MFKPKNYKSAKVTVYIYISIICLIFGSILYYYNLKSNETNEYKDEAIEKCIALCETEIAKGTILSNGPCISETVAPGWACDSVSVPANKLIDDLIDNQCKAYRNKTIKHLVTVTSNCEFVSAK
jgi:hypothetical protein